MNEKYVKIDRKQALLDPSSVFERPEDVVSADSVDRDTKIEILRRWGYDALELDVAEEENMTGGEAGMLDRVVKALRSLGVEPDVRHTPPTKHGSI